MERKLKFSFDAKFKVHMRHLKGDLKKAVTYES